MLSCQISSSMPAHLASACISAGRVLPLLLRGSREMLSLRSATAISAAVLQALRQSDASTNCSTRRCVLLPQTCEVLLLQPEEDAVCSSLQLLLTAVTIGGLAWLAPAGTPATARPVLRTADPNSQPIGLDQ